MIKLFLDYLLLGFKVFLWFVKHSRTHEEVLEKQGVGNCTVRRTSLAHTIVTGFCWNNSMGVGKQPKMCSYSHEDKKITNS